MLNLIDFADLVVVNEVCNSFSFGVSQLHEHVHATIRLSYIFQITVGLEHLDLENYVSDDDTVHDLEEQIHVVQFEADIIWCSYLIH
jgi:hypothetical protein